MNEYIYVVDRKGADSLSTTCIYRKTRLSASTPQALILTSDLKPADVLAFYKHHMKKKWGELKSIPNGIEVTNPDAPVTYVSVQRAALGCTITLTRNALVEPPPETDTAPMAFGVIAFPGAATSLRTPTTVGLATGQPLAKVITFYRQHFGTKAGVNLTESKDAQGRPLLSIMSLDQSTEYLTITIMADPQDPAGNRTAIYINKR